jgi:hypothetical protein
MTDVGPPAREVFLPLSQIKTVLGPTYLPAIVYRSFLRRWTKHETGHSHPYSAKDKAYVELYLQSADIFTVQFLSTGRTLRCLSASRQCRQ